MRSAHGSHAFGPVSLYRIFEKSYIRKNIYELGMAMRSRTRVLFVCVANAAREINERIKVFVLVKTKR